MTKWMTSIAAAAVAVGGAACSSDDTNPATSRRDGGAAEQRLSVAVGENCSRCHGDAGNGTQFYPRMPGGRGSTRP